MQGNRKHSFVKRGGPRSHSRAAVFAIALAAAGYQSSIQKAQAEEHHNIEGVWQADASRPMQCIQVGSSIGCIMVNSGFAHLLTGTYTGSASVRFDVYRRNRTDGCVTYMDATVVLPSEDSFVLTWIARDSNCDLHAGQTGTDPTYNRIR